MKTGGLHIAGSKVDKEQKNKQEFFRYLEMQDSQMLRTSENHMFTKNSVVHLKSGEINEYEE
jgi:hypothetical protein